MTIRTWERVAGVAAAVVLAAFGPCGCNNDDPNTSDLDNYFESHPLVNDPRTTTSGGVSISPASAQVNTVGGTAVFSATGGHSPYSWDVANGSFGRVSGNGAQGVYTALAVGNNNVIVHDADMNAAVASITGASSSSSSNAAAALAVSASPTTLAANGSLSVLKATGGQPPYTWTIGNANLGSFQGSQTATGTSVVYERNGNTGDNSVTVTDSLGAKASIILNQP